MKREQWHFSRDELTVYDLYQMKVNQATVADNPLPAFEALLDLVCRRAVPPASRAELFPLTILEWSTVLDRFYESIAEVNDGTGLIRKHGLM